MLQMIYTRGAIDDFRRGAMTKRRQRHTISNLTPRSYNAFCEQLRSGTPHIAVVDGQQHGTEMRRPS